jgi:hypothetical protein
LIGVLGVLAVLVGGGPANASAVKPTITAANDANHDGVFNVTENVAKNATYPWTVTFQLTLDAGTFSHTVATLSDNLGSAMTSGTYSPSCASLIGATIAAGTSATCYYDAVLTSSSPVAVSVTATFTWDQNALGGDTASATSTINFPSLSLHKSSTTTLITSVGQVVPYSYLITNTGTSQVTGITLSDNNVDAAPSCPSTTLAVAASMTCTAQHTVTALELFTGGVTNTATASSNEAADVQDSLHIPASPPSLGGTFVVGDLTVGNVSLAAGKSVTFWGAQWWKLNSLSGGVAPAAFKGFEDTPPSPTCGVNWTTDPGNSTPPPATIPPYMLLIVSSHITQSGSTIAGDTAHLLVVQTDPGYQGNPGHAGTGTIVGVIC